MVFLGKLVKNYKKIIFNTYIVIFGTIRQPLKNDKFFMLFILNWSDLFKKIKKKFLAYIQAEWKYMVQGTLIKKIHHNFIILNPY